MADIRLRHLLYTGDRTLYFYNGEASVRGGVVTVRHDRPEWAQRCWMLGYRLDPETGEELPLDIVVSRNVAVAEEPAAEESAESAEETEDADEGADGGRQPAVEDGVRSGEQPRRRSVPATRVGSGKRHRAVRQGTAD